MLALKKKREAEKKEAEEAAKDRAASPAAVSGQVSLFGIGGEKKTKKDGGQQGKKRSPGEIRIQKGNFSIPIQLPFLFPKMSSLTYCNWRSSRHNIEHINKKDIAELDGGKVATIEFPNPNDLTAFEVTISPDTGYWSGATYHFSFSIPPHYPHSPPKVECHTKIYHPNIDLQGKVCLNILREDWKPVLDINSVIYGLIYLFYEPNPDDPLNHEAAELFRKDVRQFERLVTRTLRGGILDGERFEPLI
jgi:ubiquitin-conjugating enzyme E2 M